MLAREAAGELSVAGFDRLKDRRVAFGHRGHVDVRLHAVFREWISTWSDSHMRRRSSFPDARMMTRWNQTLWRTIASMSPLARRLAHAFEMRGEMPRRPASGGAWRAASPPLRARRARIDLVLRARVVVVDERAAARPDRHQPGRLEIAQRLAHRRLARAELAGELQLDQPFAGRVVAADDPLEQRVADARADRLVVEIRRASLAVSDERSKLGRLRILSRRSSANPRALPRRRAAPLTCIYSGLTLDNR